MPELDILKLKPSSIGAKKKRPFISLVKEKWRTGVERTRFSFSLRGGEGRKKSKVNDRNCTSMTNRNIQIVSGIAKRARNRAMMTKKGKEKGGRRMTNNGIPADTLRKAEIRYCLASSTRVEALRPIIRVDPDRCTGMNAYDRYGNNLLHLAFTNNVDRCPVARRLEHIKYLLDMKPTLATERNKQGFLPLHFAIKHIYNNEDAFRQQNYGQDVIGMLCEVDPRMISVKDGTNCDGDDAFDLAHYARTRKASMSWLYYCLQKIQINWYRKQKLEWESKRLLTEKITKSLSSCDALCGTRSTIPLY